jgi:hypothetical protein
MVVVISYIYILPGLGVFVTTGMSKLKESLSLIAASNFKHFLCPQ